MKTLPKYKVGQTIYSHKNQNYKVEIIASEPRYFKDEFLTYVYELKMPFECRDRVIVNEGKISTKKLAQ